MSQNQETFPQLDNKYATLRVNQTLVYGDVTLPQHAATKWYVDKGIENLISTAPSTLDTLKEIVDFIGDQNVSLDIVTRLAHAELSREVISKELHSEISKVIGTIDIVSGELFTEISGVESRMDVLSAELSNTAHDLRTEIEQVSSDLSTEVGKLEGKISELSLNVTVQISGEVDKLESTLSDGLSGKLDDGRVNPLMIELSTTYINEVSLQNFVNTILTENSLDDQLGMTTVSSDTITMLFDSIDQNQTADHLVDFVLNPQNIINPLKTEFSTVVTLNNMDREIKSLYIDTILSDGVTIDGYNDASMEVVDDSVDMLHIVPIPNNSDSVEFIQSVFTEDLIEHKDIIEINFKSCTFDNEQKILFVGHSNGWITTYDENYNKLVLPASDLKYFKKPIHKMYVVNKVLYFHGDQDIYYFDVSGLKNEYSTPENIPYAAYTKDAIKNISGFVLDSSSTTQLSISDFVVSESESSTTILLYASLSNGSIVQYTVNTTDSAENTPKLNIKTTTDTEVKNLVLSKDGTQLYASLSDGSIVQYTVNTTNSAKNTTTTIKEKTTDTQVTNLVLSKDGTQLYASLSDGTIVQYTVNTTNSAENTPKLNIKTTTDTEVKNLALSQDGTRLYASLSNGSIVQYTVNTTNSAENTPKLNIKTTTDTQVTNLALSQDGTRLYASLSDFTVRQYDTTTSLMRWEKKVFNNDDQSHVCLIPYQSERFKKYRLPIVPKEDQESVNLTELNNLLQNNIITDVNVTLQSLHRYLKMPPEKGGHFKIVESTETQKAYMYIGNNWRITVANEPHKKQLNFEYNPSDPTTDEYFDDHWTIGIPFFNEH